MTDLMKDNEMHNPLLSKEEQPEKQRIVFLGMEVKPGYSVANVLAIPFIVMLSPIGGYFAVIHILFLL